jgi:type IV secretion system protein VirB9
MGESIKNTAPALIAVMLAATALSGCANKFIPPDIDYDDAAPAVLSADPAGPVQVVELPKPLPLPGQLKPSRRENQARTYRSEKARRAGQ